MLLRARRNSLVAVCGAAGIAGFVVYARRPGLRAPPPAKRRALAQTLLVAQVALGLLLLGDDRRAPDDLHYVYGTLALAAVLEPVDLRPDASRARGCSGSRSRRCSPRRSAIRAWTTGGA